MMATPGVDPQHRGREYLEAHPDLLRGLLQGMVGLLMGAEVSARCGAGDGERGPERGRDRNGDRPREWDTRAGTVELAIPRLDQGSYLPGSWSRAGERAMVPVVAQAEVAGVSTRRVEQLVPSLGIEGISPSLVSDPNTQIREA